MPFDTPKFPAPDGPTPLSSMLTTPSACFGGGSLPLRGYRVAIRRYPLCGASPRNAPITLTKNKPNTKNSPTPPSPQAPLPWGEGGMLHKKQKTSTTAHKKAPLSQRPKPHHLMKSERAARHRRVALSLFGGRGGTLSPHTKKIKNLIFQGIDFFGQGRLWSGRT